MPSSAPRQTAKIYQFPTNPRLPAPGRQRFRERADLGVVPAAKVVADGAWYHEAAIEEARASKR